MELDDLKGAWGKYSNQSERLQLLPERELEKMVGKRTTDISQKIGRNIRIGLGIALGWACINLSADFIFSPLVEKYIQAPESTSQILMGTFLAEVLSYILIFGALFVFWYRFNKIEKRPVDRCDLKGTLANYIKIIDAYRRMFYIILAMVLLYIFVSFATGFVVGFTQEMKTLGSEIAEMSASKWAFVIISVVLTAGVILGIYILLFNLFYKRLYGRYLAQLKSSLNELNENSPSAVSSVPEA